MQSSVYRPSEFKGSHTDAEKSAQNKKACSYFAFQFNISENWQHVASLSPRFVTPTWLLAVLADVLHCSKGCSLAEKLGISIPDPSGIYTLKRVSCSSSSSSPTPILQRLPFSLHTAQISHLGAQLTSPLHVFVLVSWNLSSTWKLLRCLPYRACSQRRVSFVAALCKIALLRQGYFGDANWNGVQHCCTVAGRWSRLQTAASDPKVLPQFFPTRVGSASVCVGRDFPWMINGRGMASELCFSSRMSLHF